MRNIKRYIICLLLAPALFRAQGTMSLNNLLDSIAARNPAVSMYNWEIKSMNEAAKGAKSWMAPQVGAGFFMTPYRPMYWRSDPAMGMPGMGSFMISAQQMFPNFKKLNAESAYMNSMSSVEQQKKNFTVNQLNAEAKMNYYKLLVLQRKTKVLDENERILNLMIESAELRYKNNMEKIGAYYKTKAALAKVQAMRIMLEADINKSKIAINTLLSRDKSYAFSIDTAYTLKAGELFPVDTATFIQNRSDLISVDKQIELNRLKLNVTSAQLRPEFGVKYDHMYAFGNQPQLFSLMGMVTIPLAPWSSKMYRSQSRALQFTSEALKSEKQMILNDAVGMSQAMREDYTAALKSLSLYDKQILPALKNNFKTFLIGYQQNTEELFMLYDAWESLNMTQMAYLDKLLEALQMQTELEKLLEIK